MPSTSRVMPSLSLATCGRSWAVKKVDTPAALGKVLQVICDSATVGAAVCVSVGAKVGAMVGLALGVAVGVAVGVGLGVSVGAVVGVAVGVTIPTGW